MPPSDTQHAPSASPTDLHVLAPDQDSVRCDGGGGTLGHPAVHLSVPSDAAVVCPYCSRRFARPTDAAS